LKQINWHVVFIRLGTISYNTDFTRLDFTSYVADNSVFLVLKRKGFIKSVARGRYYPSKKGWIKIDQEYSLN